MRKHNFRKVGLFVVAAIMAMTMCSGSAFAVSKPATPSGVKATVSGKNVTITWNKAKGATGYEVYRMANPNNGWQGKTVNALKTVDKNLSPYTYSYKVRSYKIYKVTYWKNKKTKKWTTKKPSKKYRGKSKKVKKFAFSGYSKVVTATVKSDGGAIIGTPTNVKADWCQYGGGMGLDATWSPVNGAVSYKVYVDGKFYDEVEPDEDGSCYLYEIMPGDTNAHQIGVSAVNENGIEGAKTTISVEAYSFAMNAPEWVAVERLGAKTLSVYWSSVEGAVNYNVYANGEKVATVADNEYDYSTRENPEITVTAVASDGTESAPTVGEYRE